MKLTKNFTLEEFTYSPTANAHKINNACGVEHVANLKALCENVLQPLRDHLGVPIIITSGYRCSALNKLVGGAANSQHTKGQAVDFIVPSKDLRAVFNYIVEHLDFDQLLFEHNKQGDIWIHLSYVKNRRYYNANYAA